MEAHAIELIREMALAADVDLPQGMAVDLVAVPNGVQVESLEQYASRPAAERAQYSTDNLNAYLHYCTDNLSADSRVFVDSSSMSAEAIVDYGDGLSPLWGRHRASLSMSKTAPFADVYLRGERPLSQQDMIDFLIDWAPHIEFYGAEKADGDHEPMTAAMAHRAIRNIKIAAKSDAGHSRDNMSASRTEMEEIEVRAAAGDPLPAFFTFECVPYMGLSPRYFRCRLRAHVHDKTAQLSYRIDGFHDHVEDMGEELQTIIEGRLEGNDARVYIGTCVYQGN